MRRTPRRGYTILEILVVLAVLVILGAAIVPTMSGYRGNTRQKSAGDGIRARLADARAKAMEKGTWYRLAISTDKTRIRLAPDGPDFGSSGTPDVPAFNASVSEDQFEEGVTAELKFDSDDMQPVTSGEWITIATVGPDGTCKEDAVTVVVKEGDYKPIEIRISGVTGTARFIKKSGGKP